MKKVRKKAHSQTTILPARADDGPWRWIVDNRMRDYGETNFELRVVRINRDLHRKDGELLIDTLFHEEQTFLVIERPHRLVTESTGADPTGPP